MNIQIITTSGEFVATIQNAKQAFLEELEANFDYLETEYSEIYNLYVVTIISALDGTGFNRIAA